jgi:hypothetical protein
VEILALLREGAVSAVEAARINAHLAVCARCSDIDAALTSVTRVLAATELPPMPEAFTLRIQMAIRRESAARAVTGPASAMPAPADGARAISIAGPVAAWTGGEDSGVAGNGAGPGAAGAADGTGETGSAHIPGRPDLPERRRSRSRWLRIPNWSSPLLLRGMAAAAAVLVIAGGGILLANARSASENSVAGTGGGSRAQAPAARPSVAHSGGRPVSLGAEGPVTVSYRLKGRIATTTAVASDTNMTEESLPGIVRKLVASVTSVGVGVATPGSQGTTSGKSRIGGVSISALQGCLNAMAPGRPVLLAGVARFLGRPAMMIVMRSPTNADVLNIAIVGLSCSASGLDIIQRLIVPVR